MDINDYGALTAAALRGATGGMPPLFSPSVQKAIRFSIKTHEVYQKQKRKGKDIPYITHPLTVALILARAGASQDVVIAGLLHDTMEDSVDEKKVTSTMLGERFGEPVAALVQSVTETNKALSWAHRKREALDHIETFSHDAVMLKSADVIANTSELLDDHEDTADAMWERFNAKKGDLLANAQNVIAALLKRWEENPLSDRSLSDQLRRLE